MKETEKLRKRKGEELRSKGREKVKEIKSKGRERVKEIEKQRNKVKEGLISFKITEKKNQQYIYENLVNKNLSKNLK